MSISVSAHQSGGKLHPVGTIPVHLRPSPAGSRTIVNSQGKLLRHSKDLRQLTFSDSYNIGILSSVLVHPGFHEALGYPSFSFRGTVAGVYYVGTLTSYIFVSHPISDWLGRRYAALSGTIIVCIGAFLQALSDGATARETMISGRLISGLGVAIVSTSVPLYQA